MRRILHAALLLLLGQALIAGATEPDKIRIGVEGAYPPFSVVAPDGSLKGFDIDIAKALCTQMQVECSLVQQDFDGMIPALQARKIDAIIASMSITDERRKSVGFSERYYNSPNRLIARKGANLALTPEGLKGKRIGVQRSTINDRYVTDKFRTAKIVRYGKQDEAYLDLAAGRIDLIMVDGVAATYGLLKTPAGKDFEFTGPEYTDPKYFGYGAGVAVRKNDTELRDRFSAAIKAIRANGIYKKLQDQYFDFDIYGTSP
jgi:arginine/ornithine transport system substrate-binding protein